VLKLVKDKIINKNMNIEYDKVTWYSMALAIVLYVGTFFLAFYFGQQQQIIKDSLIQIIDEENQLETATPSKTDDTITSASFDCDGNKTINAVFFGSRVELTLSDGRSMNIAQGISASGARYTNEDESFVFWNKGDTAFIQEGDKTTYENCVVKQ
jgi:membrane-bound inhibitor of C-type lysozyme